MQQLKDKSFFGHEEIIMNIPRNHTIKALGEVEVFYLNKDVFQKIIEKDDIFELQKDIEPLDVEKIARSILSIKSSTKFRVREK